MDKRLVIIGARGLGRDLCWSIQSGLFTRCYDIKGFLDDNPTVLDNSSYNWPPILSSVSEYTVSPNDVFFCALGDAKDRKKYADIIEQKNGRFISLVSKTATIAPNARIGDGSFIGENSFIGDNVRSGKHLCLHPFCVIGHDTIIGECVSIESFSFVGGGCSIMSNSVVHVRSNILRRVKIGEHSSIGAGSTVINDIPDFAHVFGTPATKIPFF